MPTDILAFRDKLFLLILDAQREKANTLIEEAASDLGLREAIREILEPVLHTIGDRWVADEISLAQGYVAGKIAEDVLLKAAALSPIPPDCEKGPVVLGNIEDDYHALGRRLVSIFLRSAGWRVEDMGNDVMAEELVDKAVEIGARIIGVSAMMFTTAENIRKVRQELSRRGLEGCIQLAVGGAVFTLRPELVAEVGGDGTADNAMNAPALFDQLMERSLSASSCGLPQAGAQP